jgi:hypothetical protein
VRLTLEKLEFLNLFCLGNCIVKVNGLLVDYLQSLVVVLELLKDYEVSLLPDRDFSLIYVGRRSWQNRLIAVAIEVAVVAVVVVVVAVVVVVVVAVVVVVVRIGIEINVEGVAIGFARNVVWRLIWLNLGLLRVY